MVPDNFSRFLKQNPDNSYDIAEICKAIDNIEDPELRDKIRTRINVELWVVLLRNEEIAITLRGLMEKGEILGSRLN